MNTEKDTRIYNGDCLKILTVSIESRDVDGLLSMAKLSIRKDDMSADCLQVETRRYLPGSRIRHEEIHFQYINAGWYESNMSEDEIIEKLLMLAQDEYDKFGNQQMHEVYNEGGNMQ